MKFEWFKRLIWGGPREATGNEREQWANTIVRFLKGEVEESALAGLLKFTQDSLDLIYREVKEKLGIES